jgi:formylglycine-generating enzyme required for sulfatase activity
MHGNVWEWCRDVYAKDLPGGTDPEVVEGSSDRVIRCGSWYDTGTLCPSAVRMRYDPAIRSHTVGFRLAAVQVSR